MGEHVTFIYETETPTCRAHYRLYDLMYDGQIADGCITIETAHSPEMDAALRSVVSALDAAVEIAMRSKHAVA